MTGDYGDGFRAGMNSVVRDVQRALSGQYESTWHFEVQLALHAVAAGLRAAGVGVKLPDLTGESPHAGEIVQVYPLHLEHARTGGACPDCREWAAGKP